MDEVQVNNEGLLEDTTKFYVETELYFKHIGPVEAVCIEFKQKIVTEYKEHYEASVKRAFETLDKNIKGL